MIRQGRDITEHVRVQCDVCVVGSGAGGGTAAMVLAQAGYKVVILEAGPNVTRRQLTMEESEVYPLLYRQAMTGATEDQAISLMQGRAVGGGTGVAWSTAARLPERVLEFWKEFHGLLPLAGRSLMDHYEMMEARLGVQAASAAEINANNQALIRGCEAMDIGWRFVSRNVRGCQGLGYCGLGCPIEAKQSTAITCIPDALAAGATLYSDCRAWRLIPGGDGVSKIEGYFHHPERGDAPTGGRITVEPQICVLAGGALGTSALMLRSEIGDQSGRVGKGVFLHPTVMVTGWHKDPIQPFYGVPQTVMCDLYAAQNIDRINFTIEAAPLHPAWYARMLPSFGRFHREAMARLAHTSAFTATLIDGLHRDEDGGTVSLRDDGSPALSYDYTDLLWDAARRAVGTLARIAVASGAEVVYTGHEQLVRIRSEADIPKVEAAAYGPHRLRLLSNHQMGGCAMGKDINGSVVNADLRHHHLKNLYIMDGSVFPTGLGVPPQLTIHALAHRAASRLAAKG